MNLTRIAVLSIAGVAAIAAAFLVRGMLGTPTPTVEASVPVPVIATTDVLVAANAIEAGRFLTAERVRWEAWPNGALAPALITRDMHPEIGKAVEGVVVRAPLVRGEPITDSKIVRAGNSSLMAATITPGKRAVSIPVSVETGAGGFILPNDRVDVVLTRDGGGMVETETILRDIRVLAIDQILKEDEERESAVARTATLELSPPEVERIAQARFSGTLSLALRALGEADREKDGDIPKSNLTRAQDMVIVRYGIARRAPVSSTLASTEAEAP